jgi:hypothetical protein
VIEICGLRQRWQHSRRGCRGYSGEERSTG